MILESGLVTILNAGPAHCRYPHGDPLTEHFHFCGQPKAPDRVYCPYHCRVAYVSMPDPRQPRVRNSAVKVQSNAEPDLVDEIGGAA